MAKPIKPSKAVLNARAKRAKAKSSGGKGSSTYEVNLENIKNKIAIPIGNRVKIATEMLRSQVVENISIPVDVGTNAQGHVVVTQRSLPGEYPRAETTKLMKTIFGEVIEEPAGTFTGYVGTPLDYGFRLETDTKLDRRYLTRTYWEMYTTIYGILTGPLK